MRTILVFCILSLSSCTAVPGNNYHDLIVGTWLEVEDDSCWSNRAIYHKDGSKEVYMEICDVDGTLKKYSYVADWSINGDVITEITHDTSQEFLDFVGLTLPHIEVDEIAKLTANDLVIIDNQSPNEPTVYRRVN